MHSKNDEQCGSRQALISPKLKHAFQIQTIAKKT